jgi:hypothetical protein
MSLVACDPCRNLDCQASNIGEFRIISKTDNEDLIFGPNKIYNLEQVKFYSLSGIDTTFFAKNAIYHPGSGYDSLITVQFLPTVPTAYIRLSNGDIDTLHLIYQSTATKCCGTVSEIINMELNNATDLGNNSGPAEIKK